MEKLISLGVISILMTSILQAQNVSEDPNETIPARLLEGIEYRFAGPTRGGRSTAVAGVVSDIFTYYMGTTGGGVWKTTDAGMSWRNISDGHIEAGSIGALAVATSDPNVIYVGTGSACPRGNVSPGIGMYKSTDAGKTWSHCGLSDAGQIGKIEIHPGNPDIVMVAALGNIFGPNPERGVFRSANGGQTWQKVLFASDSTGASDLVINPANPREVYAALWRAERKPWTLHDGGREGGIWKSADTGVTWKKLTGGLPTGLLGRIGLAVSPANPGRVWAIIQTPDEETGGLYRSDNGGAEWSRICDDHNLRTRGWYYSHIAADPKDENTVYSNNVRFHKSIDGGKTFPFQIRTPHGDHHGLWINPDHPNIMINANDGGACITFNGGDTWSTQLNQPTSEFYRITVDNGFPYRLYAGQQDNTTISVPAYEPPGITPFEHWHGAGGGESADVAVNPNDRNIVWAGTYSGEITILNQATGDVRQVTAYPHYTEGTEMRDLKYRWQWNFPIVVSRYDPQVIYHTSNYVHKTTNDGQSWEVISPDLTRAIDEYFGIPGGPIQHDATGVEVYGTIFAFEESPHAEGELWAGSDDGLLHITRDGGNSWTEITPAGIPHEATINKIELSERSPGRALVAAYNYRYADFKPYLYVTNDYGTNWKSLTEGTNGIPSHHFIRALAEDPERQGLIYAGTEFGMYVSFDNGDHWQSLQLNLPYTPITDMEIVQGDLAISTQGRAFWILEDIHLLRQVNAEVADAEMYLFQPADAIRTNLDGMDARITVYLAEDPEQDIAIDILDSEGATVRAFRAKPDRMEGEAKLTLKQGINHIEWDLRHTGPYLEEDLVAMVIRNPAQGPRVVPGEYTVRLTSDDQTQSRTLMVRADPRWSHVSREDYQAQLDLGLEIGNLITQSHMMLNNLRSIRKQMNEIGKLCAEAGYGNELRDMAETSGEKISDVEAMIMNKARASQDNINLRRVFTNHIGRLYSVVIGGHHRPTGGALERYNDLKMEFSKIEKAYLDIIDDDVSAFNGKISSQNIPGLIVPNGL